MRADTRENESAISVASSLEAYLAEARAHPPAAVPTLPLRVFISYKQKDFEAADHIGKLLRRLGGANIDVFVAGDDVSIKPASDFRLRILSKLREAQVVIFLYTDPTLQWDWCLYETGYFDGRRDPDTEDRGIYVLHRWNVPPVGPFLGLASVPIGAPDDQAVQKLKGMLKRLFVDSTSPPVNQYWDQGGCEELVEAFTAPFGEVTRPLREYVCRLTFQLWKGAATENALMAGRIPDQTTVTGTAHSFRLFGFADDTPRPWAGFEMKWRGKVPPVPEGDPDSDPVTLWIENAASKMWAAIQGEDFDDGLPLFYCQFMCIQDKALFRPSLAKMVEHADTYEFDIVFVDLPAETCSGSVGPLTPLASLLRLAHMFCFGWIEPTAAAVSANPPTEIPRIAQEMRRRLHSITAESFNQGLRTETAVLKAFVEDSDLQNEAKDSIMKWKSEVAPALENSVASKSTKGMLDALKRASGLNWKFQLACVRRYAELVEGYSRRKEDPLDRV